MTDRRLFATVVGFLGGTLLLSVLGVVVLGVLERPVDDVLKQVIVGALTGLAGLLARGPSSDEPQTVRTVPDEPLEVVTADEAGTVPFVESPRRRRSRGDSGHADGAHLMVMASVAVIVVTLYHLLVRYA